MQKLNYDLLHRLNQHTTKKLYDFINKETKVDEIIKKLGADFPFSMDDSNWIKFNTWLSIDYINEDGKTFIEKFLDSSSKALSKLEREVLQERSKSFISLFEVKDIKDEYLIVQDILQNKEFSILEININNFLNQGDFIFARIGKIIEEYTFIEDVSFLPPSVKPLFVEQFLVDYNKRRINQPNLLIKDYLKRYSLEIIKIYNKCIFSAIESDEELNTFIYDELDEFEGYLSYKCNSFEIKEHITNLIEFFDYYLSQEELTLYDLDNLDFRLFFDIAIEDGFISSVEEFNSYINTFKNYLGFLSKKDTIYKENYTKILEISKIRFAYMAKINKHSTIFDIDRIMESKISEILNEEALMFLMDFDKFLLYSFDKNIELTDKRKQIKKSYLIELCHIFYDGDDDISNYTPRDRELSLIDMFNKISQRLGLLEIQNNKLILSKKGSNFIRLKDGEKLSLIFNCIWNMGFIENENIKINIIELFNEFEKNNIYDVKFILSKYKGNPDELYHLNKYFKIMGLIRTNFYPSYTWEITKLGKTLFSYLFERNTTTNNNSSIINLDNYR